MKIILAIAALVSAVSTEGENPIRRIVTLLQKMQTDIEAEGEAQADTFAKFVCYCDTESANLATSIDAGSDAVPQHEASIKSKTELKAQLDEELATHKADREAANSAIADATAQREKEAAAFEASSTEMKTNIAAMGKAVDALRKGMGESFLQSSEASELKKIVMRSSSLSNFDSEELAAFLQGQMSSSGEIVGILEQMKEEMEGDLKDTETAEASAQADFEALTNAKNKEIAAATTAIESKTMRVGEVAVAIVNAKNDLEDTQDALAEDQTYLADMKKSCKEQTELFEQVKAARAEELSALSAAIKILNDDDALDLFKQTLPSPGDAFLQVKARSSTTERARLLVSEADSSRAQIFGKSSSVATQFMQLALSGKKAGFEKIIKLMDDFVVMLGKEQEDDDKNKEYCNAEFNKAEDNAKDLKNSISGLEAEIAEAKDALETLTNEIAALETGIKNLDAAVADATHTRKEENAEYTSSKAANSGALQLLEVAKNELNKVYNPALYKPPPERELTEEERIYVASGGELPPTPAPGGIAGTGVTVFAQISSRAAPPPPPATIEAYKKKDSSGPIALMDNLANDLEKEMLANDHEEKTAQKDYEELMAQSSKKRATDSKTITEKESQKAGTEEALQKAKKSKGSEEAELMALGEYVSTLHGNCDFLLQNYDIRKKARASESESIVKAKAVLSGADYSFVQVGAHDVRRTGFLHKNKACDNDDEQHRRKMLHSLSLLAEDVNQACVEMCKEVGAYPKCTCPKFEPPDATPGVVTWPELYDMFDQLTDSGREMLKKYRSQI